MLINNFFAKKSSPSLLLLSNNRIFNFSKIHSNNRTISKTITTHNIQYLFSINRSLLTSLINYRFSTQQSYQRQQTRYQKDPQLYHMNKNIQQLKKQLNNTKTNQSGSNISLKAKAKQYIQQMHVFVQQLANKGYTEQAIEVNEQVIKRFQDYYKNFKNNKNHKNNKKGQTLGQQQKQEQRVNLQQQQQQQRYQQQQQYKYEQQTLLSQRILYHRYQKYLYKQLIKQRQQQKSQQSLMQQNGLLKSRLIQQTKKLIEVSRQQLTDKQNNLMKSMMLDQQMDLARLLLDSQQIEKALKVLEQVIGSEQSSNKVDSVKNNSMSKNKSNDSITTTNLNYITAKNLYAQTIIQHKIPKSSSQQIIKNTLTLLNTNLNKLLHSKQQQVKQTNNTIKQLLHTVILLSKLHVIKIDNNMNTTNNINNNNTANNINNQQSLQQVKLFLQKLNPQLMKNINQHYTKTNLKTNNSIIKTNNTINQLVLFYRNTAKLSQYTKDLNKTILCYRQQRQLLKDYQLQQLSTCIFNQATIYIQLKKQQKAIEKLIKSYQLTTKLLHQISQKKKKITQQDKLILQRNKLLLRQTVQKIIQLYKKINNSKKTDQWTKIYQSILL